MKRISFALSIIVIVLSACTATKGVNLTFGNTYSKEKIEKVHIQIQLGKYKGYSKKFGQYIQEQLKAENIESTISYIDDMDLNTNDKLKQESERLQPAYNLYLKLTSSSVYSMKQGGDIVTLSYGVSISNAQSSKTIWQGGITMSVGIKRKYQTKDATKKLIEQLKKDAVI